MIDLNDYEERVNRYGGSEEKRTYYKDGKFYLVKIPDKIRQKNNSLSYMNNNFSEYISCKIFESVGISVQKTDLSVLNINGKNKIVCVCEDFTDEETTLIEYCNSENDNIQEIFEEKNKKSYQLDINDIIENINANNKIKNKNEILESFWNMFVIDALIYNKDRHNENWGFLENNETGVVRFAPVYDCGSSLFALYSEEKCQSVLNSRTELKNLAINSVSAMTQNGKKIRYFEFLSSFKNDDCTKALMRIYPKIELSKINEIIDNTPFLAEQYRSFYKEAIKSSYELVLTPVYKKAIKLGYNNNINNGDLYIDERAEKNNEQSFELDIDIMDD